MRLSRNTAFALAALALATPNSVAHADSSAPVGHYLTVHHKSVDPRATAEVPTTSDLFWSGFRSVLFGSSYVPAPRKPETDGLSRNRADCMRYGCIDNGG